MEFNFNDVGIFWINCSTNTRRHEHMKKLLETNFPDNKHYHVEAVMYTPKYQGVTMAHSVAIMKGIASKRPFIILEDDVTVDATKLYIKTFENEIKKMDKIPDVVYVGMSTWGTKTKLGEELLGKQGSNAVQFKSKIIMNKGSVCKDIGSDYFLRIEDMYGAHGIMYINKEYAMEMLRVCAYAVDVNRPHDIYFSNMMKKYVVLGMRRPWFYQLATIGGQERATKLDLSNVPKIDESSFKN